MNSLNNVNWEDVCLAGIKLDNGWNIIRPTLDGQFAVIMLRHSVHGLNRKVVKILPTLDRARAYNFAISR